MYVRSQSITKTMKSETWDYSARITVSGIQNESQADSLLKAFQRAIVKAGGQLTLDKEDKEND